MATQRLRSGSPVQVLLVAGSAELRAACAGILEAVPGVRIAGQFGTAADLLEWLVWTHQPWHYAFVDMALWNGAAREWLRQVAMRRDAGTVVAMVDEPSPAMHDTCARAGIRDLLVKADLESFRDYVQKQMT